ncbi:hypothetical protein F4801DRAFT_428516 [Xylaria longipes]|nr:hypothetical protein F4801DRAFT_428516 [Xylaria longipes]
MLGCQSRKWTLVLSFIPPFVLRPFHSRKIENDDEGGLRGKWARISTAEKIRDSVCSNHGLKGNHEFKSRKMRAKRLMPTPISANRPIRSPMNTVQDPRGRWIMKKTAMRTSISPAVADVT